MAYSTRSDILARLDASFAAQLVDDVSGGDIAATVQETDSQGQAVQGVVVLDEIIADADSFCDSYINAVYAIPVTPTPRALVRCSASIAVYYLHMRRVWAVSPEVKTAYDDAVDWLRDIRAGKSTLPGATLVPVAGKTSKLVEIEGDYSKLNMRGFI